MVKVRSLRSAVAGVMVAIAAVLLATAGPATAASAAARVILHVRQCPAGEPTVDIFVDCHSHLAPDDTTFRINGHASKTVSDQGNIKFDRLKAGTRTITLTSDQQPNEFLGLRVFCSDRGTDHPAVELTVKTGEQAYFKIGLKNGQRILCDVYFVPESGQ